MQPNTLINKKAIFRSLFTSFGRDPLALEVTPAMIEDHLENIHKKNGPKRANTHLKDIKAGCSWAARRGLLPHNPTALIEKYPTEKYNRYVPPKADILAVMMKAGKEEQDILLALLHTGGRQGEIFDLRQDDVDLPRGTLRLWTRKRKGGHRESRILAMTSQLKAVIERRLRDNESEFVFVNPRTGGPYQRNQAMIKQMMTRLCRAAGVKRFTHHAIRHYGASALLDGLRSGQVSLKELQGWLGHQRLTTTDAYIHELEAEQGMRNISEFWEGATEGGHGVDQNEGGHE